MKIASRRVPAWWVAAAAALAAAAAAAGSAIAVSGSADPVERMRAELSTISAPAGRGGSEIVRAETAQREGALLYVAASFDNPARSQSTAGVRCPRRSQAVGGGVLSESRDPGAQAVNSSFPFDGGDRNKRNDDGWIAAVDNLGLQPLAFGVYAICREKSA